ncbi:glycyl radical protein [Maribellus maritimus]|uniref:glycyl radical protein n=1 Tax=Maribellus maritimus TaxID=2870838 RepID=UPI001EE9BDB6|nr:glycyl radical protein [Maribellus maritimus]MCG6186181.1 glycyl radical protein [Maribellus maritimus]
MQTEIKSTQVTQRIANLREKVISSKPSVCTERAKFYTQIYQDNEDQPVIIKRALALEKTLKEMTIFIDDGELIVGNQSSQHRAAPIFPEYAVDWLPNEMDELDKRPGDAFFITDEHKKELNEIAKWWKGKVLWDRGRALMSQELRDLQDSAIIKATGNLTSGDAHIAVDFYKILKIGLKGYLEEIRHYHKKTDRTKLEGVKKDHFYNALSISIKAFQSFIKRFHYLATSMFLLEADEKKSEELKKIAENCAAITENPPTDFYQALQLAYFVQLVLQIESNGHSVSLGRMDQYLFPFYYHDKITGKITEEFASELLENTWIKLLSINKIRPWSHTRFSAGGPLYQNVTIGGQTTEGKDAVNELSFLILDSVGKMKLTQPNLSVRFHKNINQIFMMECMRIIEKGFGMPSFNNDEIVIPGLLNLGVEEEDAMNYSAIGCIEIAVPGKWGYRCTGMSFLNFMRVFLASMYDGLDKQTGKTFCKGTGNFLDFETFDDLYKAWQHQIKFYAKKTIEIDAAVDTALEENVPDILCSAFVDRCIPRGKTIKEGGSKYDFVSGLQVGIANLGNSLAAIKKLVFEEKRISKEQLLHTIETNFEGIEGEKTRQLLLNFAPKYGNDDDYVDILLKDAYLEFIEEIEKYHTTRYNRGPIGCRYYAGTSSISANVPNGAVVPATPDGRKAFTPVAEGSSPSSGTDILGPTAVFKSVAKLPTKKIMGGVLLNQKLSPATIQKDTDKEKLISVIRTFFTDLKGWHVQYNIVSRETLLAAKKNPEKYRDLIVRVAGYSAFFTTLSPDTQDDIIARTEHSLNF